MSEVPPGPRYAVDTNVFMDWQARFYPTDVFTSLPAKIDALIAEGRFVAPALVAEELQIVGGAGLDAWMKAHPTLWVPTSNLLETALRIQALFPGLRDPKAEYEEADSYVIALAQQNGGTVVTQETSASEKRNPKRTHFIPDACRELGLPCISLLGLMRRESWQC